MTKTRKISLLSLISLLLIIFSLYFGGYRINSKSLVDEYIEESGLTLIKDPKLVYNHKNINSYLLESEDYYISLSLEKVAFLWHFPKAEVYSYSDNFSEVSGRLMIRPKERDGIAQDSLFLYYPSMFKFNQQTADIELEILYLTESSKNQAYVFKNDHYDKKQFIKLEENIYSLKSKIPSYIENDDTIKSVFSQISILSKDEEVDLKICNQGNCSEEKMPSEEFNEYIQLYDSMTDKDLEKTILEELDFKKATSSIEILDEDYYFTEKSNLIYFFKKEDLVYAVIPQHYETTYYDGDNEEIVWEDALFVTPLEFFEALPIFN